jgi:hypothetical protein
MQVVRMSYGEFGGTDAEACIGDMLGFSRLACRGRLEDTGFVVVGDKDVAGW